MRLFAIHYLSDLMGPVEFAKLEARHVQSFAYFVAYLICRECDLNEKLNQNSVANLIKDGKLSSLNLPQLEYCIDINLKIGSFED